MFTSWNPLNPHTRREVVWEVPPPPAKLTVREDHAVTVLNRVDSPDIPFRWSLNPYRGCTHACAYCYARRTHEHLDLGAGTDFERVVFVKRAAPRLLSEAFAKRSWRGEPVNMAGVTDVYQPLERTERITRGLLEVLAAHRNPVSIITRSPLVCRDLDLLQELAAHDAVRVQISLPLLDPRLCRALEPGAPPPGARLRAIRALAEAGIPVGVSLAPILPGLNDHAIPETLQRAAEAGARWSFFSLVRLPGNVAEVFTRRLHEALPLRAEAVLDRIRRARGGALSSSGFGDRMRGRDPAWRLAEQVHARWVVRLGLDGARDFPDASPFRRPGPQLDMFERAAAPAPTVPAATG